MRRALRTPIALLVTVAVALPGCGEEDEPKIPRAQASQLLSQLRQVKRRVDREKLVCGDLMQEDYPALETQLQSLRGEVDGDIYETLEDGIGNLRQLIDDRCAEQRQEREQQPEETTPTTPEPTTPEPTTPTVPEETTPTTPTPPEDPGGDDGNNGGGNDGDGGGGGGGGGGATPPSGSGGGAGIPGNERRKPEREKRG